MLISIMLHPTYNNHGCSRYQIKQTNKQTIIFLKYFWVQECLVETICKIQAYIMYIFSYWKLTIMPNYLFNGE